MTPFRRPCPGALLPSHITPGVPLRSTPGFILSHPSGALTVAGSCSSSRRLGHVSSAPEARWIKALRSTPDFILSHPSGALTVAGSCFSSRRLGHVSSAPEARWIKAPGGAQRNSGIAYQDYRQPLARGDRSAMT